MLRIKCVYCGQRDEEEFTFGGPGHVRRPDPQCDDAEWADYLFNRDNRKGVHYERWYHSFGCRRWINVVRDTVTHEILAHYPVGEPRPEMNVREGCAEANPSRRAGTASAPGEEDLRSSVGLADGLADGRDERLAAFAASTRRGDRSREACRVHV